MSSLKDLGKTGANASRIQLKPGQINKIMATFWQIRPDSVTNWLTFEDTWSDFGKKVKISVENLVKSDSNSRSN